MYVQCCGPDTTIFQSYSQRLLIHETSTSRVHQERTYVTCQITPISTSLETHLFNVKLLISAHHYERTYVTCQITVILSSRKRNVVKKQNSSICIFQILGHIFPEMIFPRQFPDFYQISGHFPDIGQIP